jgi:hypothetical protein
MGLLIIIELNVHILHSKHNKHRQEYMLSAPVGKLKTNKNGFLKESFYKSLYLTERSVFFVFLSMRMYEKYYKLNFESTDKYIREICMYNLFRIFQEVV